MNNPSLEYIENRLSLRKPQRESIEILDKIAEINKTRIEASELKKSLYNKNTPISSQLSNLISLKLLKKERDLHDERRLYLYDIDLVGINKILQQYHSIVSKLIAAT